MAYKHIRHLEKPVTFGQWLHRYRFTIARRCCQLLLLILFIGTFRLGWSIMDKPLLSGDLSSSRILGIVPMADPYAALQRLIAQYWLSAETVEGALIVLTAYLLVSGRTFCAWICPMNLVTDFAFWLRSKFSIKSNFLSLPNPTRYLLLAVSLVLCYLTGIAAFEHISPQAMIWRDVVYGFGLGSLSAIFGIFALDFAVSRRGWCGHLCPLGAFWALWGRIGVLKVKFDNSTCTRCGDCLKECPEPQVINFSIMSKTGKIALGECTNCFKCISICPENSLSLGIQYFKSISNQEETAGSDS